jgi:hypothetical protein
LSYEQVADMVRQLRQSLGDDADDDVLVHDLIEGETSALELAGKAVMEIRVQEARASGIKFQIEELLRPLRNQQRQAERRATLARDALAMIGDASGLERLWTSGGVVHKRAQPPVVEVINPDDLPQGFVKIERTPRKLEIAKALKAGEEVPGARLEHKPSTWAIR